MTALVVGLAALLLLLGGYIGWAQSVPPWRPPPASFPTPNAFDVYVEIAPALDDDRTWRVSDDPNAPISDLRTALAKVRPELDRIRESLALECVMPVDYSDPGIDPQRVLGLTVLRQAASLFSGEARIAAEEGRHGDAAQRSLEAIELGAQIAAGGDIVTAHNSLGGIGFGGRWLEPVISKLSLTQAELALERLNAAGARWPTAAELQRRERVAGVGYAYAEWADDDSLSIRERLDDAVYNHGYWGALKGWLTPRRQTLMKLDRFLIEAESAAKKPLAERQPPASLAGLEGLLSMPSLKWEFLSSADKAQVQLDLLRLTAALRIYHLRHDRYPATLEALAPLLGTEPPTDIFSGRPLQYEVIDGDYRLWSVGPNRTDDGGIPPEPDAIWNDRDVVAGHVFEPVRHRAAAAGLL